MVRTMLKYCYVFVFVSLVALPSAAQGQYRSDILNDPDLAIEWVDTNASFWFSVYDDARGGFYTNVARDGSQIAAWGKNKNVLTQSRDAYAMVRAFQMTGDEDFLTFARGALDFMYNHGWDPSFGGWLNDLGETGTPLSPDDNKTTFDHHYALLGPMAMVEATGSETDWEWLIRGYDYNEATLWDDREDVFGYYDWVKRSGQNPVGKSFNATVDAVTTHALQLYLVTGDEKYLTRLHELADNMLDRLVGGMDAQAIGFAEKYNTNWGILPNERMTIMGHVLKTAWCFVRINQISPNPSYVQAAERLADHVLENGYDHEFGGPYKDYDRVTGEMLMWGIPDTAKAWWQMEQAVVAGLELYRTTSEPKYLEMADESLDFLTTYFQDPDFGEVYADRTRYGGAIPGWGDHKGSGGKAAYHSIETGYYAYLYGKLFLHEQVATLHYRYEATGEDRTLALSPLAAKSGDIVIAAVRRDGLAYDNFDAFKRELHLPAGTEGHFEVDFVASSAVANEQNEPNELGRVSGFSLSQNYPNPFSDQTTVALTLSSRQSIRLELFDVTGRLVRTLFDGSVDAGVSNVKVWGRGLPNGIYVYILSTPTGSESRTMILVR